MPYTRCMTKKCSACGVEFPATAEHFYSRGKKSLHSKCKTCYNKYQAEKQKSPEYREKRAERLAAQRDRINERQRKYYQKNKDWLKDWYNEYHRNRPDEALAKLHRRRARKYGNGVEKYTRSDVIEKYGSDCHICGDPINLSVSGRPGWQKGWERGLHIDHVVSVANGGPDILDNVKPSHAKCNMDKGQEHTNG